MLMSAKLLSRWWNGSRRPKTSARSVPLNVESLETRMVPAQPPLNDVFVATLYQVELQRIVDGTGLTYWRNQLNQGGSRTQVVNSILNTDEVYGREITADYSSLLGRAPDSVGWQHYMQALQQGATPQDVKASILGSDEFYTRAGGTPTTFLNALYAADLGRSVDVQGLSHWIALTGNAADRTQIAQGVAASTEATRLAVAKIYVDLLGRNPDAGGLAYWSGKLQQGQSVSTVVAGVVGSNEFYSRMQNYVATMDTTNSNSAAAVFIAEAGLVAP